MMSFNFLCDSSLEALYKEVDNLLMVFGGSADIDKLEDLPNFTLLSHH